MSEQAESPNFKNYSFNVISKRGSPTEAVLESGHTVTKQEICYYRDENSPGGVAGVKAADYHGEHFVYIDPVANRPIEDTEAEGWDGKQRWFAMCTCGSQAVIITAQTTENLGLESPPVDGPRLVCMFYATQVEHYGVLNAKHVTSFVAKDGKRYK